MGSYQAFHGHFEGAFAEPVRAQHLLQGPFHQDLPLGVLASPRAQRLDELCRQSRVEGVERHDLLGQEVVAAAAPIMEVQRVDGREGADQRAGAVRALEVEGRVAEQGQP